MGAKERVLALLRGLEASRIRFRVPSASVAVTINRTTFQTVAEAIVAGKIGVTPFAATKLVAAAYRSQPANPAAPPSGQLLVPPILGRFDEASVMHESTHAFFDLTKSNILATEEEAVCMIVEVLYCRMTGLRPARLTGAEPWKTGLSVAVALLGQYQVGDVSIPAVDADAFRTLMLAVATTPTYLLGTRAGLFAGFFGGSVRYTHDG